ncbi:Gypsy Retrotransposon Integrase-Like Protein 1 [Manis pentadactyla]|nr:Gypsy Retrotransposon Integrase-Like Protein 1 [Manis pentadactyla]
MKLMATFRVMARLILIIMLRHRKDNFRIKGEVSDYDASARAGISWTLPLRKELGSGSDVTGVQDVGSGLWVMARLILIIMLRHRKDNFRIKGEVSDYDASARAGISWTLALRKELGSGSDVTGSARCWIRVMVKCQILTKGLVLALVCECALQFHDYSETIVVSMVILEFQATGPR